MKAKFQKINWVEGAQNILLILFLHSVLVVWFAFAPSYLNWYLYLALSPFACLIHQKTVSEWIHESAHHNIVPHRNWNDILTHLLLGFWFLNDIEKHRKAHLFHHRQTLFLNDIDTDTKHLKVESRQELLRAICKDISGISAIEMFFNREVDAHEVKGRKHLFFIFAFIHLMALSGLYWIGRVEIYFAYTISLGFLYPLFNRIRVYGQHAEVDESGKPLLFNTSLSRNMNCNILDRILFSSNLMRFHQEHHSRPAIPFRHLKTNLNEKHFSHLGLMISIYKGLPKRK